MRTNSPWNRAVTAPAVIATFMIYLLGSRAEAPRTQRFPDASGGEDPRRAPSSNGVAAESAGEGVISLGELGGIGGWRDPEWFCKSSVPRPRSRGGLLTSERWVSSRVGAVVRPHVVVEVVKIQAEVSEETLKPKGARSRAEVSRTAREQVRHIERCYVNELGHKPGLCGRVSVGYAVPGDGQVRDPWINGRPCRPPLLCELDGCVLRALTRVRWPSRGRPQGQTFVTQNVYFVGGAR
jgi:hypothetical protein